jgi:hypothetical protein
MKLRPIVVCLVFLAVGACDNAPTATRYPKVDGVWKVMAAAGCRDSLSLVQRGDSITGTGTYARGYRHPQPQTGTITVTGTYYAPSVVLAFRYDSGWASVFTGTVPDSVHIAGTDAGFDGTYDYTCEMTFTRL